MEKGRIHVYVEGIVQGVGYRYFAIRRGTSCGLAGWAKNLYDGRVEVVAECDAESLKRLIADLRNGPWSARVDNIEVDWEEYQGEFISFTVRF